MSRGDIKLAIDMLTSMNDDETCDHVIGVLEKCGNTIAKLEKQRDEMLSELVKITDVLANIAITSGIYDDEQNALKKALEAIASVKESK